MKKITFTSVNLVINSVQVRVQEQGPGAVAGATSAEKQHFLNVNGSFSELGGLGFYRDFPITEAEATSAVPLTLAEKLIKAEFAKFAAAQTAPAA